MTNKQAFLLLLVGVGMLICGLGGLFNLAASADHRHNESAATMCHVRGGIAVPSFDPDGQPTMACVRELEPK